MMEKERFNQQIKFILEVDKLKKIMRKTILTDRSRLENSAEHSWHVALSVIVFSEYAVEENIDCYRVIRMLLIHDLVEIDAGDTYCYDDKRRKDKSLREGRAADRIFSLLPADQQEIFRKLWDEFEERKTPESKFANALDRIQPFLHNYFTHGKTWRDHGVRSFQVKERIEPVKDGSEHLWAYVTRLLEDAVVKGYIKE